LGRLNRRETGAGVSSSSTEITISISIYRGWIVTTAAAVTGLVLGVLYVWSVVRAGIPASWGWSKADTALPYSLMCAFFAITMIPAGRLQDRFGPRVAILVGGLLAGLGCVVCGLGGSSLLAYAIGFGALTGSGVGFGYAATTPASIKWFPPQRTGLIAGIVVAGFGLAPVVLAPLTAWLLDLFQSTGAGGVAEKGVPATMITLGVITWVVVGVAALFVRNPPEGHLVQPPSGAAAASRVRRPEFVWREMLRTAQFWLLFVMYFFGASAGLTFISVASDLGKHALGTLAFLVVVVMAAGNASGRILTGTLSDRIGRQWTLLIEFVWQALVVAALYGLSVGEAGWAPILIVVFMLGFNYGTNLAVFPAACKDCFGIRNFGLNYGCLFAAFGSAGLVMPWVNGLIVDKTGSADLSYAIIIGLLVAAALLSVISRAIGQPGVRRAGGTLVAEEGTE
jgi:OFA family oxalate/formate antiporter-like MFS transporter